MNKFWQNEIGTMLKMTDENEEPPDTNFTSSRLDDVPSHINIQNKEAGFLSFVKGIFSSRQDTTLRETIEEYIEDESSEIEEPSISVHEKLLIANVLELRDMCASDIMVPRADIVAISHDIKQDELFELLSTRQYSRLPVYKNTLDNVLGSIHVKDVMATLARGDELVISDLVRDTPIVSPSMPMLDLLLQMRITRKHMVLVVDEYGGIDGLVTIGDVIESIVGEIDDEHDPDDQPEITVETNGTIVADARVNLEEFEEQFGSILTKEEHDENDTLGGLVFSIAGRVPARGEVLTHESGTVFEIVEADPRRVKRLNIRNIPQ